MLSIFSKYTYQELSLHQGNQRLSEYGNIKSQLFPTFYNYMKISYLRCHKIPCTHQAYAKTQQCMYALTSPLDDFLSLLLMPSYTDHEAFEIL